MLIVEEQTYLDIAAASVGRMRCLRRKFTAVSMVLRGSAPL